MRRTIAIAAALAVLAIVVSGCGGGGGSSSSTASDGTNASASGDDVSAAANEACAAANKKIAALGTPDSNEAVTEYLEETEQAVDQLQAEVTALNGPADIQAYALALSQSVEVLTEMANASRSRNLDGVREISKELEKLKVGQLAEAAGLETCAETPGVET